jgi:hypothetical protein
MDSDIWTTLDTAAMAGLATLILCLLVVVLLLEDKP